MRIFHAVLVLAVALVGAGAGRNALAEVLDATPLGFTVSNRVAVPVTAAEAWDALVNDIDAWWPRDHTWWDSDSTLTIDAVAGGCFCERTGDTTDDRQARHLEVAFVDPEHLLRLLGGLGPLQGLGLHGVLEFRLTPAGTGTSIEMWYRTGGYVAEDLVALAPIVDAVQAQQVQGLADFLGDNAD